MAVEHAGRFRKLPVVVNEAVHLTIAEVDDVPRLVEVSELFREIWGKNPGLGPPINADLLRAIAHSGGYVAAAYDNGGQAQGALVGFLGNRAGRTYLHSHILGVRADRQARGTGMALKLHQRGWALERGYNSIEWTFDPLVRRNAYFNLTRLGAEISSYLVNFYGVMDDAQNRQDESDRVLVSWQVRPERARPAAPGADRTAPTRLLTAAPDGTPVAGSADPGCVAAIVQVPVDIVSMRSQQPSLAREWRFALREALVPALEAGYRCHGVTRDGEYLLTR
ncbi:MAG: hypothetical protein NVSMB17_00410 [Candidatus Dormibacteria bacterium]